MYIFLFVFIFYLNSLPFIFVLLCVIFIFTFLLNSFYSFIFYWNIFVEGTGEKNFFGGKKYFFLYLLL
uniref:Uncharacterized protein n=1 Tax=Meloidogyne enterolobii TaxID=390850 RepID=A0A6V7XT21_MELEN|nr:unnamed protein product [Meloidogyne enterolobii]